MREQAKTLFCALSDIREEFLEELVDGQEPERRAGKALWRRLAVAGLAAAALFALTIGANAATGGRLFEQVGMIWKWEDPVIVYPTELNGDIVKVAVGMNRDTLTLLWQLKEEGSITMSVAMESEGKNTVTLETITLEEVLEKFGQESLSMTVEYTDTDGNESRVYKVQETMTLEELLDRLEGPGKLRPAEKEKTP